MKSELEKLRDKQKVRRRKRTVRLLLLSPLIVLTVVAVLNSAFRIRTLTVRNGTEYRAVELTEAFGFGIGDGIFSVREEIVSKSLSETFPYVKSATVCYRGTNSVEITVEPSLAAYAVKVEDGYLLLDDGFKALETVESVSDDLLLVRGMDVSSYSFGKTLDENLNIHASTIRELCELLKKHGLYDVTSEIDLTKKYNVALQIHGVITVRLGTSENLSEKFDMLMRVLSENDPSVPAEITVRSGTEGRYYRLPADSSN